MGGGQPVDDNLPHVSLEAFACWNRPVTRDVLEDLPKTIRKVCGVFQPQSLQDRLCELFFGVWLRVLLNTRFSFKMVFVFFQN